jgi:hypothetical protein
VVLSLREGVRYISQLQSPLCGDHHFGTVA